MYLIILVANFGPIIENAQNLDSTATNNQLSINHPYS